MKPLHFFKCWESSYPVTWHDFLENRTLKLLSFLVPAKCTSVMTKTRTADMTRM